MNILVIGPDLSLEGGINTVQNLVMENRLETMRFSHLASVGRGGKLAKASRFFQSAARLLFKLSTRKFDIIHVHASSRGSSVRKALLVHLASLFKVPIVFHSHSGAFVHTFDNRWPLVRRLVESAILKSSVTVVVNESDREYFARRFELTSDRLVVLCNPVELPCFDILPRGGQTKHILFLGKVSSAKGTFDLLQAFARLPLSIRRTARLVVAGGGETEEAKCRARQLGIDSSVDWKGWVSREACRTLLKEADIFTLPSYSEGLPMALLEAMAWQLPVVTTPVGGIPELVVSDSNGLLIDPGDIEGLTCAITRLLEDAHLRARLGDEARHTVTALSIERYMVLLDDIYQRAVVSASAPNSKAHG